MAKEVGTPRSVRPGSAVLGAGPRRRASRTDAGSRRVRFRPLYAGVLVWAGVFGLLWVFG